MSYQINKALILVATHHGEQVDKQNEPYIFHLVRVATQASQKARTTKERELYFVVGLLHDLIEDTSVNADELRKEFSDEIVDALLLLTHRESEPYDEYIERIAKSKNRLALIVKHRDIVDNLNRLTLSMSDYQRLETKYRHALVKINLALLNNCAHNDWPY